MDHIELENKLTIFRHALTNMSKITLNRIDNLCNTIHRHNVESINQDIFIDLYGSLGNAIDDTKELLIILKNLKAWLEKSLPHPIEKSQNETNKEEK